MKLDRKFFDGVFWNIVSLGVIAVCGVMLNLLIPRFYEPVYFGVFGFIFASFTIIGQLAVGGFVFGLLHYLPPHTTDRQLGKKIFASGFYPTLVLCTFASIVTYLSAEPIGRWLQSPLISIGLRLISPGIFLFAINKYLLYAASAFRMMRLFAFGQSIRVASYLLGLLFFRLFCFSPDTYRQS